MGIIACGTKPFPAIPKPSIACYKTCEPSLGPCCVTKLEAAINRKTGSRACLGFFSFVLFANKSRATVISFSIRGHVLYEGNINSRRRETLPFSGPDNSMRVKPK